MRTIAALALALKVFAAEGPPPCVLTLDRGSSRNEVITCLGQPDLSAVDPAGKVVWVYYPSWMSSIVTASGIGKQDKIAVVYISSGVAVVEAAGALGPGGLSGIWCPGRSGETVNKEQLSGCTDFGSPVKTQQSTEQKSAGEQRAAEKHRMEMEEIRLRQQYWQQLLQDSQPPPPPNPWMQMIGKFACMMQYKSAWQKFLYCQ